MREQLQKTIRDVKQVLRDAIRSANQTHASGPLSACLDKISKTDAVLRRPCGDLVKTAQDVLQHLHVCSFRMQCIYSCADTYKCTYHRNRHMYAQMGGYIHFSAPLCLMPRCMQRKPKFHVLCIGTDEWTLDADKMADLFVKDLSYPPERVHVLNKVGAAMSWVVVCLLVSDTLGLEYSRSLCVVQGKGPTDKEVIDKILHLKTKVLAQ